MNGGWAATPEEIGKCALAGAGVLIALEAGIALAADPGALADPGNPAPLSDESRGCVACHKTESPNVVEHWLDSKHAAAGVGCNECHAAAAGEPDAWRHEGALVSTIVSPKDCAACHDKEAAEFKASHHAQAAEFIGSLDNVLGEIIEGTPAATLGCQQCHGSTVQVLGSGKLDPATWPNTGMGRKNPDGSRGSCSACHVRHTFSAAQARRPENCGRCHMGPDHPQIEIYEESKHGIKFAAYEDEMNLDADSWVLGEDYSAAPTCVTCHMGATGDLAPTHDAGARIAWTLRPVVSKKLEGWEQKRKDMRSVCLNCHATEWVGNFFTQYDNAVTHYNEKFAEPAKAIMDSLKAAGKVTPPPFDDAIEWTFYELWHHEGRRARMGAAMMGPDYTQWHGFYEVAKRFYFELVPEAEALLPGVTAKCVTGPMHAWRQGLSKEEIQQQFDFYRSRYKQ